MITSDDAIIGERVKKLRGETSQAEVASEMRSRGHAWKKQTVYNIESGQRQLKLIEARDLLACLGYDPAKYLVSLTMPENEKYAWEAKTDFENCYDALRIAMHNYGGALRELEIAIKPKPNQPQYEPSEATKTEIKRMLEIFNVDYVASWATGWIESGKRGEGLNGTPYRDLVDRREVKAAISEEKSHPHTPKDWVEKYSPTTEKK
ncbi:helix-turn-helix transcriptional regulator [Bifidobacterium sp. ESL0775]|uniref:helix-turn-helix domain-containing protein n=1 Tax=Bifidobacterium sp. ESL0775 TaxID=2983230 RepID=UPI0023F8511D|nr:helix-turn-helix transcriptional regulator [Bifidobacterium sp. ESL0775]WEV69930.1 helix-turn-helix transcriptional regulator [Bifidobacterium sp. ESL0775]